MTSTDTHAKLLNKNNGSYFDESTTIVSRFPMNPPAPMGIMRTPSHQNKKECQVSRYSNVMEPPQTEASKVDSEGVEEEEMLASEVLLTATSG